MAFGHLYVHEMFDALTPPGLATPPRKGIGARIVRGLGRMGAALHGVVAGRLRRRPSRPGQPLAPDADGSTAAMPARAPRRARRTPIVVPERHDDLAFTEAAFPDLSPAAREFLNTPLEECDPAMVGLVLEALAEAIAGMMTPQEGMQDARDVFLALSSRLGALTGGMQGTPPESVPADPAAAAETAAADRTRAVADPDATGPQAASPDLPGSAPAAGSAAAPPDGSAGAQGEAAAATAGSDQPAAPPVAQPPSGPALNDAGTNTTPAPHDSRVGPRQSRRRSFRGGRQFAAERFAAGRFAAGRFALPQRTDFVPQAEYRRLCEAAAAAALLCRLRRAARIAGRAEPGAPCHETCTGPPHGGPAIPDSSRPGGIAGRGHPAPPASAHKAGTHARRSWPLSPPQG